MMIHAVEDFTKVANIWTVCKDQPRRQGLHYWNDGHWTILVNPIGEFGISYMWLEHLTAYSCHSYVEQCYGEPVYSERFKSFVPMKLRFTDFEEAVEATYLIEAGLRTFYGMMLECEDEPDEHTKYPRICTTCGRKYRWSADDIAWKFEQSPFMPCGDIWDALEFEDTGEQDEEAHLAQMEQHWQDQKALHRDDPIMF